MSELIWRVTKDRSLSGQIVAKRRSEQNPNIIFTFIIVSVNNKLAVCDTQDGYCYISGTEVEIVDWLNKCQCVPIPKIRFRNNVETLPENRSGLPMMIITHCGI